MLLTPSATTPKFEGSRAATSFERHTCSRKKERYKSARIEDAMRRQINEENGRGMTSMTEEEIETERKDIVERFGTGVGDLLKTVEEAMERRLQGQLQGFSPFESLSLVMHGIIL
ncbi:hypothetical protein SERLA73DRAFT_138117, partial [Serpula lacrymans var. lacrymans S7.3]